MGIIKRQSIKNSIINYFGVIIGASSTIFIYPLIDSSDMGLVSFIIGTVSLLTPFASFALSYTVIHYFPVFKDENRQHNGILFLVTASTLFTSLFFVAFIYFFRIDISFFFKGKEGEYFLQTLPYILIITLLYSQSILFNAYASNFNRIVVPNIFLNLLLKLIQPLLILLFYWGYISLYHVFSGLTIGYGLSLIGLVLYISYLGQLYLKPNTTLLTPQLSKQILSYSSFNILVLSGAFLSSSVDKILIGPLLGFEAVAIFSVASLIADTIDIPRKALSGISAPLISESMKNENFSHVEDIYRKSALLQTIAGVFFLAGIWACLDSLFDLMPKNRDVYKTGEYVVLILGLTRLVDMSTGINSEIITYSKYYRFNLWSLVVMAIFNIIMNFVLMPKYGIIGSALATLISTTIVNYWRMFFIYKKIKIHPLDIKMLWVLILGFLAWYCSYITPSVLIPFVNIFIKGLIVSIIFLSGILYFKLNDDIQALFIYIKRRLIK